MTTKLNSSTIDQISYNNDTLLVTFTTGKEYEYLKVPAAIVNGLIKADSVGKFFNKEIRPNYKFQLVS